MRKFFGLMIFGIVLIFFGCSSDDSNKKEKTPPKKTKPTEHLVTVAMGISEEQLLEEVDQLDKGNKVEREVIFEGDEIQLADVTLFDESADVSFLFRSEFTVNDVFSIAYIYRDLFLGKQEEFYEKHYPELAEDSSKLKLKSAKEMEQIVVEQQEYINDDPEVIEARKTYEQALEDVEEHSKSIPEKVLLEMNIELAGTFHKVDRTELQKSLTAELGEPTEEKANGLIMTWETEDAAIYFICGHPDGEAVTEEDALSCSIHKEIDEDLLIERSGLEFPMEQE